MYKLIYDFQKGYNYHIVKDNIDGQFCTEKEALDFLKSKAYNSFYNLQRMLTRNLEKIESCLKKYSNKIIDECSYNLDIINSTTPYYKKIENIVRLSAVMMDEFHDQKFYDGIQLLFTETYELYMKNYNVLNKINEKIINKLNKYE